MKLTLQRRQQEISEVESFFWQADEPVNWKAGQYMVYDLPHDADNRGTSRFFTISNAPFEGLLRNTTRFTSEHSSSFKSALRQLKVGDTIEGKRVAGSFTIEDPTLDYVFIAGGIGITPFRSILLDLDHRNQPINAQLLYSNRDQNFVFKTELDIVAQKHSTFRPHYFVDPRRIDEATISELVPNLHQPIFMVSGPEPMVESFQTLLTGLGVPPDHIKRDDFPGYTRY